MPIDNVGDVGYNVALIFYCYAMKAKIYELDVDIYEGGFTPMYRVVELDVPTKQDAVGIASKRHMNQDNIEYLVVVGDFESSPNPEYFTEKVMSKCEETKITLTAK